jgi:hypothetical protein
MGIMARHKTREGYSTSELNASDSTKTAPVSIDDAGASVLYEYVDPLSVYFEWRYGELVRAVPLRDAMCCQDVCRSFASLPLSSLLAYALSICSTGYTFPVVGDDPTTSDYVCYVN